MSSRILQGIKSLIGIGGGKEHSWLNGRVIIADIPVDADQAKQWLPFALRLSSPAKASVFFAYYPETTFCPAYHEAAILLHVRLFGIFPAVHCPWMLVDDDTALILGREMLGYPKKMGQVTISEDGNQLDITASRRGVELMRLSASIGASVMAAPPPGVGQLIVNMRGLISTVMPAHLIAFRFKEKVHQCNTLENINVRLFSSECDPVNIATGPAESGHIRTCSFGFGKVPWAIRVWLVNPMLISFLMRLRAL